MSDYRCTCAGPDGPCEGCVTAREAWEEEQAERRETDRADAERYRWLRDPSNSSHKGWDEIIDANCAAERMDELIDAELAAMKGAAMTVYVCPTKDIDCGHRWQNWCPSCPLWPPAASGPPLTSEPDEQKAVEQKAVAQPSGVPLTDERIGELVLEHRNATWPDDFGFDDDDAIFKFARAIEAECRALTTEVRPPALGNQTESDSAAARRAVDGDRE